MGSERARLLLLVDDWDVLASGAGASSLDHAMLLDRLLGLLRQGEAHGLTTVVAGDRSLLLGRVASVISRRVLLRLPDRADAALAGLTLTALTADAPPGRGGLRDGSEVQLAVGPARPAMRVVLGPGGGPARLDPLPTHVAARDLPIPDLGAGLPVGLGGDAVQPLTLREESDGRRWLVTGARGSGVSSALLLLARGLVHAGRPVTVVAPRPGPLDALRHDRRLVGWSDAHCLTAGDLPREWPSLAVVVDCADELLDTRADDLLRDFSRQVERRGGLLVVGASATTLVTQYRGVGTEVARERTGILLGPRSGLEGDLFGLRLRADPQAPPGRGHLVRRGRAVTLQVAHPGTPSESG
jgi:S-DNA-T family DNA segregation ATPase FtsK/SpoIIIE